MNMRKELDLDGEWLFLYTPERPVDVETPLIIDESRCTRMPVPAYWEDHIEIFRMAAFWNDVRINPEYKQSKFPMTALPPDLSLPNIIGTGWYSTQFTLEEISTAKSVTLILGGVHSEAWIWLNRELVGYHRGFTTGFEVALDTKVRYGERNELTIAVSNIRTDLLGCSNRGPNFHTGGIFRGVKLRIAEGVTISDLYLHASVDLGETLCRLQVSKAPRCDDVHAKWSVLDSAGDVVREGKVEARVESVAWSFSSEGMRRWSEREPYLYTVLVELFQNETLIDSRKQTYGLRRLIADRTRLYLNGKPIMLRGVTEHCYFPDTVHPSSEKIEYRKIIRKLKELGFNWVRFHTWIPPVEYIEAADELGMMLQVEPPAGFDLEEWKRILFACRSHPSVVVYCCGNEELIDEEKIAFLEEAAEVCHQMVPDALFSPMEALRGVEYYYDISNLGDDYEETPFKHNRRRLEALKRFSDVFGQYARRTLSYCSITGDSELLDSEMEMYERPCLTHEMGIHGTYIDLDLEHRYDGTRIGSTGLFASVRACLDDAGLLTRAATYYRNSCAWQRILRKHVVETARRCKHIAGYDYLGPIDQHWHRFGYPCGIMNEFYEMKPGETERDVVIYNGASVVLSDLPVYRNVFSDSPFEVGVFASLFGDAPLGDGILNWHIESCDGVHDGGTIDLPQVPVGEIVRLNTIRSRMPGSPEARSVELHVMVSGGEYRIENSWKLWVYFRKEIDLGGVYLDTHTSSIFDAAGSDIDAAESEPEKARVAIVASLDDDMLERLGSGATVVLLGSHPFKSVPTSFQISIAGRVDGNLATVVADHPMLNGFSHEGFCDWQFYPMLEGGRAVLFDDLDIPFEPIIEIVSSFKRIRKQAAIFEMQIDSGILIVCSLAMDGHDPGVRTLLSNIVEYSRRGIFDPKMKAGIDELRRGFDANYRDDACIVRDYGYDPNARKKRNGT